MLINNYSYNNLSNKGVRIALRSKVDSALITGIAIIDAIIPIGRGQRQLILGNRYTGKTYIIITTIISNAPQNLLASNYSIGTRRLFSIYIAINHNLSKMSKIISLLVKIE
jgi:F-type H+-transporting ATPase subunit alpha